MTRAVTLQISLAPSDFRHAKHLLHHQVRTWRNQVSEILFTIDFHRSTGRFSERWAEGVDQIVPLAKSIDHANVVAVDYSAKARAAVGHEFFGGAQVPEKDFRGGPYYAYFFGLIAARYDHILHLDSDMFFGGGSQTWLGEAIAHMAAHPDVLLVGPLSGPPARDGKLRHLDGKPDPEEPYAFSFDSMTTRLFLISRSRFHSSIGQLTPRRPPQLKNNLIALLERNPVADLPEHLITAMMRKHSLYRREFLGNAPGMWSLHPPYRGADFYTKLPDLIRRIEAGEVPSDQMGDHDINDSMVDWSEGRRALRHNRLWYRVLRRWRDSFRSVHHT